MGCTERGVDALLAKDYPRAQREFAEANGLSPGDRRVLANLERLRPPAVWAEAGLKPGGYFVMTLHRPANVDDPQGFALAEFAERTGLSPVVVDDALSQAVSRAWGRSKL